jgi:hypothetical protein
MFAFFTVHSVSSDDNTRESHGYVAIKFKNCNFANEESAEHELTISEYVATVNPSCTGFGVLRTVIDSFEVGTPYGKHKCLVYAPMRESLHIFRRRFGNDKLPLPILKAHLKILLLGLGYLHSACEVVRTGEIQS